MIKGSNFVRKGKKAIQDDLRREFVLASKDETFTKLCARLKCDEELLMKYTSKLETTVCELKNCSKCKSLDKCKNEIEGHVYYPAVQKNFIYLSILFLSFSVIKSLSDAFINTLGVSKNVVVLFILFSLKYLHGL